MVRVGVKQFESDVEKYLNNGLRHALYRVMKVEAKDRYDDPIEAARIKKLTNDIASDKRIFYGRKTLSAGHFADFRDHKGDGPLAVRLYYYFHVRLPKRALEIDKEVLEKPYWNELIPPEEDPGLEDDPVPSPPTDNAKAGGRRLREIDNAWRLNLHLPKPLDHPASNDPESKYSVNVRTTDVIGRDEEEASIDVFASDKGGFRWMQIAGVAGQGKTRLAYELALRRSGAGWHAGFLSSAALADFNANVADWAPDRPHLILIDYVLGHEAQIGKLMGALASQSGFKQPVCLILLERQRWDRGGIAGKSVDGGGEVQFSLASDRADWFTAMQNAAGEFPKLINTREPLVELTKLTPPRLVEIVKAYATEDLIHSDEAIEERLKKVDEAGRPLFARFLAEALSDPEARRNTAWTKEDLLNFVLSRTWTKRWNAAYSREDDRDQPRVRKEPPRVGDDTPAMRVALAATLTRGMSVEAAERNFEPYSDPDVEAETFALLDAPLGRTALGPTAMLPPLEPDLLGGWFVLRCAKRGLFDLAPLLDMAWRLHPLETGATLRRIGEDFPDEPEALALFEDEPQVEQAEKPYLTAITAALHAAWKQDCSFTAWHIERLKRASDGKNGDASGLLGLIYHFGNGVDASPEIAAKYHKMGADQGADWARDNWGWSLMKGIGVAENAQRAMDQFEMGVQKKRSRSQTLLADLLLHGPSHLQDHGRTISLLRDAAEADYSYAMFYLARNLKQGTGLDEADPREAMRWYRKAAEAGHTGAMFYLAVNLMDGTGVDEADPREAMCWYRKAAEAGNTDVMFHLAVNLMRGTDVCEANPREAMRWYRKAAEAGDTSAMFYLAVNLMGGTGVNEADPREAMRWYRKAAEAGNTNAMVNLAVNLMRGTDVDEADPREAMRWYHRAAEADDSDAMFNLAENLEQGTGVEEANPREAMRWYRKAAEAGHGRALRQIAVKAALGDADLRRLIDETQILPFNFALTDEWADRPPIKSDWRICSAEEIVDIAPYLSFAAAFGGEGDVFAGLTLTAVRRMQPACYPDLELVDVQFTDSNGHARLLSALIGVSKRLLLDGDSVGLHAVNLTHLTLADAESAKTYLRLYCGFVGGDAGPYHVVESWDELPLEGQSTKDLEIVKEDIAPIALWRDKSEGHWRASAWVLYGADLSVAEFKLAPDGLVDVFGNEPKISDLPVRRHRYDGLFRSPFSGA